MSTSSETVALNFAFTKPCEKLNLCKNPKCSYAHDKNQFRFMPCRNDLTCRYKRTTCKFFHTDETIDSHITRTGKELPNFDPLPEPTVPSDPKCVISLKAKKPQVLLSTLGEPEKPEKECSQLRSNYKNLKALVSRLSPESQEKVLTNFSRFVETMLELEMTGNL